MLLLALAAAAAAPQPGTLRTFGDWTVGCDNVRTCQAVALVPEGKDRDAYLLLVVRRDGGASARPTLTYSTGRPVTQARGFLRVDGRVVGRPTGGPVVLDPLFASALSQGQRATLTDTGGRVLGSASLKGLAAIFLYMDEHQQRLGTQSALIRRGSRSDGAVPVPPPLPRIVQPRASSRRPGTLSVSDAARLIGPDNARCDGALRPVAPRAIRLDAARSLSLVSHPCGNGAYNSMSSAFVVDEAGRAMPAAFDAVVGMDPNARNVLVNADWDAGRRRLDSFSRGRGWGDCGVRQSFAWDGRRFRLAEQAEMGECRGSIDYITSWRAAVTTAR